MTLGVTRSSRLRHRRPHAGLQRYIARARLEEPNVEGVVTRLVGMMVEATAPKATVGDFYTIGRGERGLRAEVVAVKNNLAVLMPYGQLAGLGVGDPLVRLGGGTQCPVGDGQLGRVLDALGAPLDGGPPPEGCEQVPLHRAPLGLTQRRAVNERMDTGVRALNAFVPFGVGQRMGIFAGPGVGKSTLLGMLARGCSADVIVMGLIGERGREVGHFVDEVLQGEGRKRSIIVAATSDRPASERVRAAFAATAIAEHFRDRGKKVLLFVDSLTRLCMAQRDIGLATGEPPTSKGYPPSAFSLLPRLLERVAPARGKGAITGVYTVLVEGDDMTEPVADAARGLLDGHVVLSRKLATRGHFPAIDVLESLSRLEGDLLTDTELASARRIRGVLGKIDETRELVGVGAYRPGADPSLDAALRLDDEVQTFLQQPQAECIDHTTTQAGLTTLVNRMAELQLQAESARQG